jgi:hypothetical protein
MTDNSEGWPDYAEAARSNLFQHAVPLGGGVNGGVGGLPTVGMRPDARPQQTVTNTINRFDPVMLNRQTPPPLGAGYWNNAGNAMGSAAENVIMGNVTGAAFDPIRLRQQDALSRAEQGRRAATAAQVHRSGFSGTPLGAMAGNAAESDLLRNRFSANLDLEAARQDMMRQGAGMAVDYANTVNRFAVEDREARQRAYDDANSRLATDVETNLFQYRELGIDRMTDANMAQLRQRAPTLVHNAQNLWTATGGGGDVPMWFIQTQYAAMSDPRYSNQLLQVREMLRDAGIDWSDGEFEAFSNLVVLGGLRSNPDTGQFEIDEALLRGESGDDRSLYERAQTGDVARPPRPPARS